MKQITPRHQSKRTGSVLLLVVITMSMLSLFAVGATENSRTLVSEASADRDLLAARLGAESAIQYANQRLYRDNDWMGSSDWVSMAGGVQYRTIRYPNSMIPGAPAFSVEARAGDAKVMLEAQFEIGVNNTPFLDDAIALLGGSADLNNVQVDGDMAIVDTEGGVMDYDPMTDTWHVRTSGGDPTILANNNIIDGDLGNYTGTNPGINVTGDLQTLETPMAVPNWNLDQYAAGGPGIEVYTNKHVFRNLNTNNTVVVIAEPGAHLDFKKCNIRGGVIIWAPEDWPQRGAPRNTVDWSNCTFGDPNNNSVYDNIGMIAPASQMRHGNNMKNDGHGVFHYHSIDHLNNTTIEGALWVTNEVNQLNGTNVTWDPEIATSFFEGLKAGPKPVEVLSVSEFYPAQQVGQSQTY